MADCSGWLVWLAGFIFLSLHHYHGNTYQWQLDLRASIWCTLAWPAGAAMGQGGRIGRIG